MHSFYIANQFTTITAISKYFNQPTITTFEPADNIQGRLAVMNVGSMNNYNWSYITSGRDKEKGAENGSTHCIALRGGEYESNIFVTTKKDNLVEDSAIIAREYFSFESANFDKYPIELRNSLLEPRTGFYGKKSVRLNWKHLSRTTRNIFLWKRPKSR